MFPSEWSKEARKKMGGYIPVHMSLAEKIGYVPAGVLAMVYRHMKDADDYALIPSARFHAIIGTTKNTLPKILQGLRDKGLLHIKMGPGGKHATKQYKVDLAEFAALNDMTKDFLLNGPKPEKEGVSSKQTNVSSKETHVSAEKKRIKDKGEKCIGKESYSTNTPKEKADEIQEEEFFPSDSARRAAVWGDYLDRLDPSFLQDVADMVRRKTNPNLHMQTIKYVVFFVLDEYWRELQARSAPTPPMGSFLSMCKNSYLHKRWVEWDNMWAFDLLSAMIWDEANIPRTLGQTRWQMKVATTFSRLYDALILSAEFPEMADLRLQEYLAFIKERREQGGPTFGFGLCASGQTLREFDESYPPAAGKPSVAEYVISRLNTGRI